MAELASEGLPNDITIVGSAMAGLYSAWRLLSAAAPQSPLIRQLIQQNDTGKLRVCFLEQSGGVGGRPDSHSLDSGWGDGALRTAETVLTQYFQLPSFAGDTPSYVTVGTKRHGQ